MPACRRSCRTTACPMTGRDANKNPIPLTYEGVDFPLTGFAFSKSIVTDLLRDKLGFKGYVNSDTGIINSMAWGLEDKTVHERVAAAINGGTDTLVGLRHQQDDQGSARSGPDQQGARRRGRQASAEGAVPARPVREPVRRCQQGQHAIGEDANRAKGLEDPEEVGGPAAEPGPGATAARRCRSRRAPRSTPSVSARRTSRSTATR